MSNKSTVFQDMVNKAHIEHLALNLQALEDDVQEIGDLIKDLKEMSNVTFVVLINPGEQHLGVTHMQGNSKKIVELLAAGIAADPGMRECFVAAYGFYRENKDAYKEAMNKLKRKQN